MLTTRRLGSWALDGPRRDVPFLPHCDRVFLMPPRRDARQPDLFDCRSAGAIAGIAGTVATEKGGFSEACGAPVEAHAATSLFPASQSSICSVVEAAGGLGQLLSEHPSSVAARLTPSQRQEYAAVVATVQALLAREVSKAPLLTSSTALLDYLHVAQARLPREQFRVLFLDRQNRLIADEVMAEGTVNHVPVYPREVLRRAIQLDASALVLVHNHPGGDETASKADIDMTRDIVSAAETLGIAVHDHIIVSRKGHTSFRAQRLM